MGNAREFGVAQADGSTVFFGLDPNRTFAIMAREGSKYAPTPIEIDERIRERRSKGERRPFLVVLWGGLEFATQYRKTLKEPDFITYCASLSVLDQLDVEVIDRTWEEGDQRILLDEVLYGS